MFSLVVLAAGKGSRMKSERPKLLHLLMGEPLLEYAIEKGDHLNPEQMVLVVGHGRDQIMEVFSGRKYSGGRGLAWAVQEKQLGTGHAAKVGIDALVDLDETEAVLIMNGDLPLLRPETLELMIERHRAADADVTVLTCKKADPTGFGRILRNKSKCGALVGIVEENDADEETRAIQEVNVGTYIIKAGVFQRCYEATGTENDQGERYLTDVVAEAACGGSRVETVEVECEAETAQVNSQEELAAAQRLMRERLVVEHLEAGVQIDDPSSTFIEKGAQISAGAIIHPFCVIRRGVVIGSNCEVGPFTHLRSGGLLEDNARVGNFVEVKNSRLGAGSKASHLSYIGDADVGENVNIGAGTIFANYDGKNKYQATVKDRAFIGSGSILVAPVTVGEDAMTGAGAVVLQGRDVPDGEAVVGVPARLHKRNKDKDGGGDCQD